MIKSQLVLDYLLIAIYVTDACENINSNAVVVTRLYSLLQFVAEKAEIRRSSKCMLNSKSYNYCNRSGYKSHSLQCPDGISGRWP